MKPSTKPADIARALSLLLERINRTDAEFPDTAWDVASSTGVDYSALVEAYDEYCANH